MSATPGSQHKKVILAIDDDEDQLRYLRHVLQASGYECHGATSVEEGRQALPAISPHLVLLDLQFSGGGGGHESGFDFLFWRQSDRLARKIPVIIFSGQRTREAITQALALKADDFAAKPLHMPYLLQKIRKALFKKKQDALRYVVPEVETKPRLRLGFSGEFTGISPLVCEFHTMVKPWGQLKLEIQTELFHSLGEFEPFQLSLLRTRPGQRQGESILTIAMSGVDEVRFKDLIQALRKVK